MKIPYLARAFMIVAFGTIISRIFGLFREIFSAKFFGTTFIYDAFLLAFMIPNFFRGLVAEGALSTAFIPVFTEYIVDEKKKSEIPEILNSCFTLSILITFSLFIIFFIISNLITKFFPITSKWFWVFDLLKFTFPYLIFISLASLNMGILHSYKHFLIPSLSPIILDIFWIFSLFFICPFFGESLNEKILGLCIGIILGGIGQFLFQLAGVKKRNISFRLNFNFTHPAIKKMVRLIIPVIFGVAVGPINLLTDYTLANFLSPGMVSALWFSTRVYQLPLGIFGISLSTVALPSLSENVSKLDFSSFRKNLYFAFRILLFLLLPSTIYLIIMRNEIITFLFKRGIFDVESVKLTAFPLACYSIGIMGYGAASILTRCFYSFKDTASPVKVGIWSIGINFFLDIVLMRFFAHGGIALSTSIVGFSNFAFLFWIFQKKHLRLEIGRLNFDFLKILLSSTIYGIFLCIFKHYFSTRFDLPLFIFTSIIGGVGVYLMFIKILKIKWDSLR